MLGSGTGLIFQPQPNGEGVIPPSGLLSYPPGGNYVDTTNSETEKRSNVGLSNATPQPGMSMLFTGSEYVTVPTTTLVGDFVVSCRFNVSDISSIRCLFGGVTDNEGAFRIDTSGYLRTLINSLEDIYTSVVASIDTYYFVTFSRAG